MAQKNTFYWYDYETFGANPKVDRLAQFAGIRTDMDLNVIGEPLMIYCQPADDFLPQPEACLITGITPQQAKQEGLPEAEFINLVNQQFAAPNTCVVGYNNLRFDDEFTRYSLYRNLHDPYAREWRNGCSRWDLIDVVRLTRALRPEGVVWPVHEDGSPSIRLEDLTRANGIAHDSAHDALSDVYATIALAKLIKKKQPRLYDYAFNHRGKKSVFSALNVNAKKPVLHISGMYPSERGNMALVIPLAMHPTNKNGVIVFDLSENPEPLYALSAEEISKRIFTPKAELPVDVMRIPLKTVHANKCPILSPINTLSPEIAQRYGIDLRVGRQHLEIINRRPTIAKKLQQVFSEAKFEQSVDPDFMLYGGSFFSASDRESMDYVHTLSPNELLGYQNVFEDDRLPEMLFRYKARNWPEALTDEEREMWQEFRMARLSQPESQQLLSIADYFSEIERLRHEKTSECNISLLNELAEYGREIML